MAKTAIWGQTYKVLMDTGLLQDQFTLDSSQLNGPDVLDGSTNFADVTEYVTSINIRRGRAQQLDAMTVGQASIVLDDKASGRSFDPANTASPFVQDGYGIAPRRFVEIYGGTAGDEPLFVGRVNDLDIDYRQPDNSFAIITCVDDLSVFGRTSLTPFTPTAQLTSARINTILNRPEVAYSTATRDIATGVATVGTAAYDGNDNVKNVIDGIVYAEDGRFFINRGGTAVFQSRISFTFDAPDLAFSDLSGTAIPYQELSVGYGAETLYNRIQVGVQNLAISTAADTTSINEFGVNTFSITDVPLSTQTAGDTLAANLLAKYKDPVVRFNEMTIILNGLDEADAQAVSTLDIGDLVQVSKTYTTGAPTTVTKEMYVENIAHEITPGFHRIRLGLGQATVLTQFILGGYTTTQTRTNLITNPSFETNTTGWASAQVGFTRSTAFSLYGTASGLATMSSTTDSNVFAIPAASNTFSSATTYTVSGYFYVPIGSTIAGRTITISFEGGTATGTTGTSSPATLVAGSWVRASRPFTVTATGTKAIVFRLSGTLSTAVGQTIYIDGVLSEQTSTLRPYFDGSTADAYSGYTLISGPSWTGTANASTSTATWGLNTTFVGDKLDDPTVGLG